MPELPRWPLTLPTAQPKPNIDHHLPSLLSPATWEAVGGSTLDEPPCLLQGSLGKASLPKHSVKEAQGQNPSGGQVGAGPGTTWSMIEGRGHIAAAHRGRCDSFLLLEELPWVVRPLGNNGRCLLGAQEKDQSQAGQAEAVPVGLSCPVPQLSPLPPILTSSSGSLPLHPSGHPGEKRDSVLGTRTRSSCFL